MTMSQQITVMLLRRISMVDMVFLLATVTMNMALFFLNQSQMTIDILDIEHVHDRTSKYS